MAGPLLSNVKSERRGNDKSLGAFLAGAKSARTAGRRAEPGADRRDICAIVTNSGESGRFGAVSSLLRTWPEGHGARVRLSLSGARAASACGPRLDPRRGWPARAASIRATLVQVSARRVATAAAIRASPPARCGPAIVGSAPWAGAPAPSPAPPRARGRGCEAACARRPRSRPVRSSAGPGDRRGSDVADDGGRGPVPPGSRAGGPPRPYTPVSRRGPRSVLRSGTEDDEHGSWDG